MVSREAADPVADANDLKRLLVSKGLRDIPKILTLQDRNPHSPTYGCFDRNFWHYKIIDFPSGMAQEFVLPLALAWKLEFDDNPFFNRPALLDWIQAGIGYAIHAAHSDGSCDDYYPFEKAAGAAAFSLYAMLRSIEVCELDPTKYREFLVRRSQWLANHRESGILSNHEALIANCLFRTADLTENSYLEAKAHERMERLLTWQSSEGWFKEYDGADPGYLTLTLGSLAEIDQQRPELGLRSIITKAIDFLDLIQPPDGWLGGEWTSRNTHNYFPHGFELIGAWLPKALEINSRAVHALRNGPEYSDDHIVAHHCWSYLLAASEWISDRPEAPDNERQDTIRFPEAGLIVSRKGKNTLLTATKKGGALRYYEDSALRECDTGVSMRVRKGRRVKTAVCHIWAEDNEIIESDDAVQISGKMSWSKTEQMTPVKLIILRCIMISIGRFKPDLVRRLLQKLLITGKNEAPFHFSRRIAWLNGGLTVTDTISGEGWNEVVSIGIGPAQTSIYTVMSRVWHPSQFCRWTDLSQHLPTVQDGKLVISRTLGQ